MQTTFLDVGLACLLSAVIGGGLKAFGFDFPLIASITRQLTLGVLGILLIIIAVGIRSAADAPKTVPLPRLDYGVWTLKGTFDDAGEQHVLDGSILRFSSQSESKDGLLLEGTFAWRLDGILLGDEAFKGHYDAATRGVFLEGVAITESKQPGIPQGSLVLGSYSAILSLDERTLVNGRNGSTRSSVNAPVRWEGER